MDSARRSAANRDSWNRRCETHVREWYRLEHFRRGGLTLDDIQLSEVGNVADQTLLHLQCNAGIDTLSWVRQGARATGVDFSLEAIRAATRFAEESEIAARFLCCDLYRLDQELQETFDIVYTSQGVLCWLDDLPTWGRVIAHFLKPDGFFYIMEEHPFSVILDRERPCLNPRSSYFHRDDPDHEDGETYQWSWSLSDIVNSLVNAGLRIEFLNEHPVTFYQRAPYMESEDGYWWQVPGRSWPLMFTLKASLLSRAGC